MIIDTHTHFYDPTRPEGVPWPNPDDDVLYRRVMPDDYKALAVPEGATGTVVVEASKWLDDNQWILDLAADEPPIGQPDGAVVIRRAAQQDSTLIVVVVGIGDAGDDGKLAHGVEIQGADDTATLLTA